MGLIRAPLTAADLTVAALHTYVRRPRVRLMPCWTPVAWWECDIALVSGAGWLTEIEIKTTRKDYVKDWGKERILRVDGKYQNAKKHELLAAGLATVPKYFMFLTPVGLLKEEEVPSYAGWSECDRHRGRLVLRTRRPAPMLKGRKLTDDERNQMQQSGYYRYLNHLMRRKDNDPGRSSDLHCEGEAGGDGGLPHQTRGVVE